MATAVSPTSQRPRHDVTLTDGTDTVGFILTDSNGQPNPRAISDAPQQRTALKTSSGDNKYSDLQPPWGTWVQDDWSGGRGIRWNDDDKSRFYTDEGIQSWKSGELTLQSRPQLSGTQPWHKWVDYLSDRQSATWVDSVSGTATSYIAQKFVAPTGMTTVNYITLLLGVSDTYSNISAYIVLKNDNSGVPGTTVGTSVTSRFYEQNRQEVTFWFSSPLSVTAGNTYWIWCLGSGVQWGSVSNGTPGSAPYTYLQSANGTSSWADSGYYIPYRVTGNALYDQGIFLTYKGSLYYISRPSAATFSAKMYLNGDRGAADSNTGALTTLVDATKSGVWTENQWAGCIVKIIAGPGIEEDVPERYISSNTTAGVLTVSTPWKIEHTTATEYVIIDTDYWQEIEDFSITASPVKCAVAADNFIYIGWGTASGIIRYEAYNNAGTWTDRVEAESPGGVTKYAHEMTVVRRGETTYLYSARYNYTAGGDYYKWAVEKFEVPKQWGELIGTRTALIAPTNQPWDADSITNVTQFSDIGATKITIAAALAIDTTNGTIVAAENLDTPVDISLANYIGFYVWSNTAVTANKMQIIMDDTPDLGKTVSPIAAFDADAPGASATFTEMSDAIDGSTSSTYTLTAMATTDRIYVISDRKFNRISFNLSATVNNNASALSAYYYNGSEFTQLTLTAADTAATGTSVAGATFAQDGYIEFVPPDDWEQFTANDVTGYVVKLNVSATLDDVGITEISVRRQNLLTCTVADALVANQWQWIDVAITPTEEPAPDATSIQSIGLRLFEDNGDQTILLRDGIWAISTNSVIDLPNERINNMIAYSGNSTGVENCWVFTDQNIYELQSEIGDEPVRLPIDELRLFSGSMSGKAACVNDVYLWFNLGKKIERYYLRNLDDIGPDKDEGMVAVFRDGTPQKMISYPGMVFLSTSSKDEVSSHNTNSIYSNILAHRGGGWHTLHKSPAQSNLGSMAVQRISSRPYSWMFFQQDSHIFRVMIADDPYNNTDGIEFTPEGTIETGWLHCGMIDVYKTFGDIKIFGDFETLTGTTTGVYVDYKTDDDTYWTSLANYFNTTPSESAQLNITCKKLKLRLRLISIGTFSKSITPRIYGLLVEYFAVVPTKYNYGWTSVLKEGLLSIDLHNENELALGYTSRCETAYAKLKAWADAGTKLTQNSRFSVYDNKTVILNAPASQPIQIDSDLQHEEILISVSTFDL